MATSDSKDDAQRPSRARPTASAERPSVDRLNPLGLKVDPQTDDAGWDAEAAEALADVYAAAGHPIVDAAAWSHSPWLDTALVTPRPRPPFIDQSWLEDRLTEIARHFESTLLALKPDQAIADLGQRLDQAENRLTSAVSGLNSAVGAVGTTQAAIPRQISDAVTGVLSSQALTGQIDRTVGKAVTSAVKSSADDVAEQVSLAVRTTVADSVTAAIDRSVAKAVTGAVKATSDDVAETISLSVKSAVTDAVTLAVKSAVKNSVADAVADNVNTTVKSAVQDVVTLSLRGAVRSSVADAIADSMGTAISDQISDAVTGALARELTAHSGGMAQSIQTAVADAVAQSLADVPTKADIDGLYQINGQLNDMLDRFDRTDERLARLDDLDGEIQALSNRLSDDRITLLAGSRSGSASQISEADIEHAARTASEQVAREMLARMPAPNTDESEQIHDIRALLETVISEQRQGDEMTSTMLDTLQQAMLTVLDRVDTLEATAARLGQSPPPAQAREPAAPPTRRGPASAADDFDGASTFDPGEIARRVDRMAEQDAQGQPAEPPSQVQPRRTTTDNSAVSDRLPMRAPGANRRPEPTKEEFISAARRGMRPSQPTADEQPPAATDGRTPSRTRTLASDQTNVTPAVRGKTDRRVLLAVIAVLGLGAGFQLLSRPDGDTVRQAAADRPTIAAAVAVDGTVPAPADAPIIQASAPGDDAQTIGDVVETSASDATAARPATVAGMLLQTGGPAPTPAEIQALRHREAAAYMSNRTGAQVFGTTGAQTALPMGMTPSAAQSGSASVSGAEGTFAGSEFARSASPSAAPVERKAPIEMPPATVGPLSLLRAAQSGDPSAQFEVASRMAEARGTPQSFSGAVTWYTRAAEQGFAPAEFRLATMYERGLGVASDLAQARDLYQRAAEKGHVKAMHNLAVLAASKTALGEPDYVAARPWFERAAALGLTDSQFNLAVLLESGLGMTKDIAQAYKWQALAAKGGDKQALKRREVLAQQVDAVERATLDAEIAAWRPKPQERIINEARLAGEIWKSRQAKSS